jgi:hypothetical protein
VKSTSRTVSILHQTNARSLQGAVERLRSGGLSRTEAAVEIMRQNFDEWIDGESDGDAGEMRAPRLRIVKR